MIFVVAQPSKGWGSQSRFWQSPVSPCPQPQVEGSTPSPPGKMKKKRGPLCYSCMYINPFPAENCVQLVHLLSQKEQSQRQALRKSPEPFILRTSLCMRLNEKMMSDVLHVNRQSSTRDITCQKTKQNKMVGKNYSIFSGWIICLLDKKKPTQHYLPD